MKKSIIDCLNTNYGIAVTALTLLPIGADMHASVYKAETRDGLSYFVKLKHGHHYDVSVTILTLLQMSGIQQTGLQIADLVAHPIGRHVINPKQENRSYNVLGKKFHKYPNHDGKGLKIFPK